MIEDCQVEFMGHQFECVDKGFGSNVPVDVVVRPEDIYIFEKLDAAQFTGQVTSCIFKGVHYEMMVTTADGYEVMVQDYNNFDVGDTVGMLVKPFDIQVMKKERVCNTFAGIIVDKSHVRFLGNSFACNAAARFESGDEVLVEVDFKDINLMDNERDGDLSGSVSFILYKGNHYHLTIQSGNNEHIYVDTNDIWDDNDRVGINIAPEAIQIEKL
jgi:spermidine/putrescine transport system ATP-binding protein